MSDTVKVAIIGPKESGKTRFSNHVTVQNIPYGGVYDATVGVRTIQHTQVLEVPQPVSVELWDVSGDQEYEYCWPAIIKDLDGIIVVFNPHNQTQNNDARVWCEWFCLKSQLGKGQCVMLAVTDDSTVQHAPLVIMNGEFNVPIVNVSVSPTAPAQGQDESSAPPTTAARAFGKIVNSMYKRKKAKQQQQQQQQQPV